MQDLVDCKDLDEMYKCYMESERRYYYGVLSLVISHHRRSKHVSVHVQFPIVMQRMILRSLQRVSVMALLRR